MANREEGADAPNCRQGQEQPQHQDAAGQRHIHLNWSNLKPEFSGKLEEDAEAHLLRSNDWMEAHHFDENMSSEILSHIVRGSKVVVSIFRTFRRYNMATTTKLI